MQILLSMMLIAQPPTVPDGPPAVPDQHPADSLPIVFPTADFKADAERWIKSSEPLPPAPKAERDDGFTIDWPDGTWTRAVYLHKVADLSGAISISGPWHGRHVRYAHLSNPTRIEVQAALETARETLAAERSVSQTATGKSWPLTSAGETVDPDLSRRGPWPDGLDFPEGMKRYKRAAYTQSIFQDQFGSQISPIHRLDLPNRDWHQSGGMLGIKNFRSDLYRNAVAVKAQAWTDGIPVKNRFNNFQTELGWKVQYGDGSKFMDVLSYEGRPFEVRVREKKDGKWQSSTPFQNELARPPGYKGLEIRCSVCHDQAGTGGYAAGLVPGGDGVLSVGFKALEKWKP